MLSEGSHTIVAARLADGYQCMFSKDDIKTFPPSHPMLDKLPETVKAVFGSNLTKEHLINLAKTDKLDIMFKSKLTDRQNQLAVTTRASLKRQALEDQLENLEDEIPNLPFPLVMTQKSVSFDV